jgi:serine/threonine-protein kinase
MGAVYEVEHVHTGEHLALKVLASALRQDASVVERFKREARFFARIRSDYVVRVIDADVSPELGNAPYLAMELLEGEDFAQLLRRDGPQPPSRVADWISQISRGLAKAHAIGIVHRDLKPANLFLSRSEDGRDHVKVLDFGVAKMLSEAESLSTTGSAVGTPSFMSPEQIRGKDGRLGPPADQWALGMVAYDLLVGHPYWRAESPTETIAQILFGDLAAPSDQGFPLGEAFDSWFLRSCDRDPSKRWASVTEQAEALCRALQGVERLEPPAPVPSSHNLPPTAPLVVKPRTSNLVAATTLAAGVASPRPSDPATGAEFAADRAPPPTKGRWFRRVLAGTVAVVIAASAVAVGTLSWRGPSVPIMQPMAPPTLPIPPSAAPSSAALAVPSDTPSAIVTAAVTSPALASVPRAPPARSAPASSGTHASPLTVGPAAQRPTAVPSTQAAPPVDPYAPRL